MRACCWVVKDRRTAERVIPAEAALPTEAGTEKECSASETTVLYARESAPAERLKRSQTTLAELLIRDKPQEQHRKLTDQSAEIKTSELSGRKVRKAEPCMPDACRAEESFRQPTKDRHPVL